MIGGYGTNPTPLFISIFGVPSSLRGVTFAVANINLDISSVNSNLRANERLTQSNDSA